MSDKVKENNIEVNIDGEYEKLNSLKFALYTAIPVYTYLTALRGNPIYTGIKLFVSPQTYEIPLINIAYTDIKNGKEPFYGATSTWIKCGAYMTTGFATVPMYVAYKITPEKKMKKLTKFIDKGLDKISKAHKKVRNAVLGALNKVASKIVSFIIRKDIDIADSVKKFFREKYIKYFDEDIQKNIREEIKKREIKLENVDEIFDNKSKEKDKNLGNCSYVKDVDDDKVVLGSPLNTKVKNRDKVLFEL